MSKAMSRTEVFKLIKDGNKEFTLGKFFDWCDERDKEVEQIGYKKGYKDGVPKERYQGEFGARSNY